MKDFVMIITQIMLGFLIIWKKSIFTKPIHLIAITFFTMLMTYSISSFLPILGECLDFLIQYANKDVVRF